ncbi:hypothetical protein [Streptomyces sp. MAR4 CNX-425]
MPDQAAPPARRGTARAVGAVCAARTARTAPRPRGAEGRER